MPKLIINNGEALHLARRLESIKEIRNRQFGKLLAGNPIGGKCPDCGGYGQDEPCEVCGKVAPDVTVINAEELT